MSFPGDEEDSADENREQNGGPKRTDMTTAGSRQDRSTESEQEHPPDEGAVPDESTERKDKRRPPAPVRRETASGERGPEDESVVLARDILTSIVAVLLLGAYIFMMSGVWPPMVAVESGSMEPNLEINDLVFVMDNDRFHPSEAHADTGVVTAEAGAETGYTRYGDYGDVIVFAPEGDERITPVIHRTMFWVEEDENWYDRANEGYLGGADSCEELSRCPAPNDGFITKGDRNPTYDQAGGGEFNPVETEWVIGTAEQRVPGLGWLRLQFE